MTTSLLDKTNFTLTLSNLSNTAFGLQNTLVHDKCGKGTRQKNNGIIWESFLSVRPPLSEEDDEIGMSFYAQLASR